MRMLSENNPQMVFRVVGPDGVAVFNQIDPDAITSEYEIDIQEAPTSFVQKQNNLAMLLSYAQQVSVLGMNIYPALIDELPISNKQKAKIAEAMTPPQPSPEAVQQQEIANAIELAAMQAKIQNLQADTAKKRTEVPVNLMKAVETEAKAALTRAETAETALEAEQKDLENQYLRTATIDDFNVNI